MPHICRRSAEICGRIAQCYRGSAKGNCVRETRGSYDRVSDGDRSLGCDCVVWGTVPDVSKDLSAFTFRVEQAKHFFLDSTLHEGSTMPRNFRNTRPVPQRHIPENFNLNLSKGS